MGDSPDDEALARELHRELNVGPRRRQRRQAVPQNRSNPPQKRARSVGSSSGNSTTNDDSDDFSDRLIPRSAIKPGQRRGSEPQEDGQVESAQNASGPLQRSQTAPPPGTVSIKSDTGTTTAPKPALAIPTQKSGKLSAASAAPKSSYVGLIRKYGAPIQKRATPPNSPRHKKPKTSPPTVAKQSKVVHTHRSASQAGSYRQGAQLDATVPLMKSISEMKAALSGKVLPGQGQTKLSSRASQSGTPATQSVSQDNTSDDDPPPIHKAAKERQPNIPVASARIDKPKYAPTSSSKGQQPGISLGKSTPGDASVVLPTHPSPKPVVEKLGRTSPGKSNAKLNEHKPPPDASFKAASQDVKPRTNLEQRILSVKSAADQGAAAKPMQQKALACTAAALTQTVAATAPKATASPAKASLAVSKATVPADSAATPTPNPAQLQHKGGASAQRLEGGTNQKAPPAPPTLQQSGAPTSEARSIVRSWPEDHRVALPTLQVETLLKGGDETGRPDDASAGSTPRAAEEQSKHHPGLGSQDTHNGRQKNCKSCGDDQQDVNDHVQDHTATAQQPAAITVKLGAALNTMYPGARSARIKTADLEVTLVNLRGRQYFHFPANSEISSQGNVPWQEASAQATHMLLTA